MKRQKFQICTSVPLKQMFISMIAKHLKLGTYKTYKNHQYEKAKHLFKIEKHGYFEFVSFFKFKVTRVIFTNLQFYQVGQLFLPICRS